MRVALIDPSLFTLPYDRMLARGLRHHGHEVTLHGRPDRPEDGTPDPALRADFYRMAERASVRALPGAVRLVAKGLDHALSAARLVRCFAAAPPDVVHLQWCVLPLLDRLFFRKLRQHAPVVLTVHDTDPFNGNPSARMQLAGFGACLTSADALIVHTRQGHDRLQARGLPRDRIWTVPHGPLASPPQRRACEVESGPVTFVLFGKLKPYKGVDVLVAAFAALQPALRARARLRIVGQPFIDLAPLHRLIAQAGMAAQVTIEPGIVPDHLVPDLFAPGTVAMFPYREIEASGVLSIVLPLGRPVIASAIGAFAEQLNDGRHGHLVPPGDVRALSGAMRHMIEDAPFRERCARQVTALGAAAPTWAEAGAQTTAVYASARADWARCRA